MASLRSQGEETFFNVALPVIRAGAQLTRVRRYVRRFLCSKRRLINSQS